MIAPLLAFKYGPQGGHCYLSPGTYTLHGPATHWDPATGAPALEALIRVPGQGWFLARCRVDPHDLRRANRVPRVWDSLQAVERRDATNWLLGHRWLEIPLELVEGAYGCDLAAGPGNARHLPPPPAEPPSDADAPRSQEAHGGIPDRERDRPRPPWSDEELRNKQRGLQPQEQRLVAYLWGRGRVSLDDMVRQVFDAQNSGDLSKDALASSFHRARRFLTHFGYTAWYSRVEGVAWIVMISQPGG
jgi:hypothetical protein